MKVGKVSENIIKRSVLKTISESTGGSVYRAEDSHMDDTDKSAVLKEYCALFTGYVTGEAGTDVGRHAVIRALNRASEADVKPLSMALSVTMPDTMREKRLREIVGGAASEAAKHGIGIVSGHSESVAGLKYPIVTVTLAAGKDARGICSKVRPGQAIVMTKWAGIYGSAWIASEHTEGLKSRLAPFITEEAGRLWEYIDIGRETGIAARIGCSGMYACGDGGVYAGLWKLADRSGVGLEVSLKSIPIRQETIELCEYYDINPYKLRSDGALLIATDTPDELIQALVCEDIPAAMIGTITDGRDRVILSGEERRFLEEPTQDEQMRILCYNT